VETQQVIPVEAEAMNGWLAGPAGMGRCQL
jgi:hypothetical protein